MSERVSDGLIAELERKINDGTPRGMVWQMLAPLAPMLANCVTTDEEVRSVNEILAALIVDADDRALEQLEFQACLAQLQAYLDRDDSAQETPDA